LAAPVVMLSSTRDGSRPAAFAKAIDSHTDIIVEAMAIWLQSFVYWPAPGGP
jgi:hypothetical protein